jgi:hypothetical protein
MSKIGVVHIQADTQRDLCSMFVRPQEFYESPYPDIRGHYFTLDQFKKRYSPDHGGFTYLEDWRGFNIPGNVIKDFFKTFDDLTNEECFIQYKTKGYKKFYLIGTFKEDENEEDVLAHELCHASYYLDKKYFKRVNELVNDFRKKKIAINLEASLKNWGYSDNVLTDELNAYMATTNEKWWDERLGDKKLTKKLIKEGEPFRKLAAEFDTNKWIKT